jgi:hypothetical protein
MVGFFAAPEFTKRSTFSTVSAESFKAAEHRILEFIQPSQLAPVCA